MSGGILPGMNSGPTMNRQVTKNRMQSNIFGVDENIKTEYSRTSIGHDVFAKSFVEEAKTKIDSSVNDDKALTLGLVPMYIGSNRTQRYSFSIDNDVLNHKLASDDKVEEKYQNYFFTCSLCTLSKVVDAKNENDLKEALKRIDQQSISSGYSKMLVPVRTASAKDYSELAQTQGMLFNQEIHMIPVIDNWISNGEYESLKELVTRLDCNMVLINEIMTCENFAKIAKVFKEYKMIPIISMKDAKEEMKYAKDLLHHLVEDGIPAILSHISQPETLELLYKIHHSLLSYPIWALLATNYKDSFESSTIDHLQASIDSGLVLGISHDLHETYTSLQYGKLIDSRLSLTSVIKLLSGNMINFLGLSCDILKDNCLWSENYEFAMLFRNGKLYTDKTNGDLKLCANVRVTNDKIDRIDRNKEIHKSTFNAIMDSLKQEDAAKNDAVDQAKEAETEKKETANDDLSNTRRGARRDMHQSSFSLSGAQADDHMPQRTSIRTKLPPGGGTDTRLW